MIETSNGEHSDNVQEKSSYNSNETPANPENPKTGHMHRKKRNDTNPINPEWFCSVQLFGIVPRVEPADEGTEEKTQARISTSVVRWL